MKKTTERILTEAGYFAPWRDESGHPPALILAIADFASERPGLDWRDYAPYGEAYRQDSRNITRQFQDVKAALRECYLMDVTNEDILKAAKTAWSGRLEIEPRGKGYTLHYCAGQYHPTEYRGACAAVLEQAARYRLREKEAA